MASVDLVVWEVWDYELTDISGLNKLIAVNVRKGHEFR